MHGREPPPFSFLYLWILRVVVGVLWVVVPIYPKKKKPQHTPSISPSFLGPKRQHKTVVKFIKWHFCVCKIKQQKKNTQSRNNHKENQQKNIIIKRSKHEKNICWTNANYGKDEYIYRKFHKIWQTSGIIMNNFSWFFRRSRMEFFHGTGYQLNIN